MVDPGVGASSVLNGAQSHQDLASHKGINGAHLQLEGHDLGNNGAKLARGGRNAVGGGTVPGGEDFAGHDEGGRVGAKVCWQR